MVWLGGHDKAYVLFCPRKISGEETAGGPGAVYIKFDSSDALSLTPDKDMDPELEGGGNAESTSSIHIESLVGMNVAV